MARRRIADDPTSRLAIWARRCALFSFITTVLAVVIVRAGILEPEPALATFAGALLFAIFGIALAFGSFVTIWNDGVGGAGHALSAIAIGAALIAYPGYLGYRAYTLPMINDITTDPIDPPRFEQLSRLRPRGTVEYAGLYAAEQQRIAYPDIEPLTVDVPPIAAHNAALAVLLKRKWRVVADRPPQPSQPNGQIEVVARTAIMGFRDDVAIRVRPDGDGARIDMRSASRYGHHDFGTNAARIRGLLDDIDAQASASTEERRERPAPKPKPAPARGQPPAKR